MRRRLRACVCDSQPLEVSVMTTQDSFLTTAEVAARFRTSPSTVRYWRHIGAGPRGTKFGTKVLYRESEVQRWERERELAESAA
ncbi:helix-turn-helix transcriptional regulator [Nonomuraea terrae]|uniref:helix-turn-helix transcriptional regulator n=1 Tax=Nonomuraea terrae TaxID=2530383 RepID=UPI003799D4E8